ncbi:R3H-associated N-terminal domain-containing protein [Xylogone sp. PMI_703]|nr:R3H-associated N-terminal domain-containing protein [Xylogone sp. PMI_703]
MAIYSAVPPPEQQQEQQQAAAQRQVDIEAWTVSALESLTVSTTTPGLKLSIPLDDVDEDKPAKTIYKPRREPLRRDSQKRREALLKGKEGSRRRQRWENDHLLHVPNAQPPLPSDWEVHPTYPVHAVPYHLAPLWDGGVRHRAEEVAASKKRAAAKRAGVQDDQKGRVPQELKMRIKKSKGAKTLLQELEEEIREFVKEWETKQKQKEDVEVDSEDDEIVFVGRNGTMSDEQRETVEKELQKEKLIFDSLADDHGASFGRWLVHSIAAYYGLSSRSVTTGNPARREVYVSIKEMKSGRRLTNSFGELPRPLGAMNYEITA